MFLLGSEKLDHSLKITSCNQLQAIDQVLEEDPSALNKLQKLTVPTYSMMYPDIENYAGTAEEDNFVNGVFDLIGLVR